LIGDVGLLQVPTVAKTASLGCVAKYLLGIATDMKSCFMFSLGSSSKRASDEPQMTQDLCFVHAMHLTLSDRVHHFLTAASLRHALSNQRQPLDAA
jgi:hypothetical protein